MTTVVNECIWKLVYFSNMQNYHIYKFIDKVINVNILYIMFTLHSIYTPLHTKYSYIKQ